MKDGYKWRKPISWSSRARRRDFEYLDNGYFEIETIFHSEIGGLHYFHWSFRTDEEPGGHRKSNYSGNTTCRRSMRMAELTSNRLALGLSTSGSLLLGDVKNALNNPLAKFWLSSRNPMKASEFSRTHSLASQLREGGGFRAFRVAHAYAESTPPQASFSFSSSTSVAVQSTGSTKKINFCQWCGCPTNYEIPDGDDKTRAVCTNCGKITYENPKMVAGCLVEHENKILLCKRKIQPSFGLWTLPAGYIEIGESAAEGAIRETWEEATAEVEVLSPFALLDIPLISHIYIFFLGKLKRAHFSPGPESQECQLFALEDIPLNSLAFSSMVVALKMYTEDREAGGPKFHYAVINKWPGSGPSDIHAHTLALHLTF